MLTQSESLIENLKNDGKIQNELLEIAEHNQRDEEGVREPEREREDQR